MHAEAPPEIRAAAKAERAQTLAAITAAFVTDPLARFALPQPDRYLRWMSVVAEAMGGASFDHASAYVVSGFAGAALWMPPGVHGDDAGLGDMVAEAVPPDRVDDLVATMGAMAEHHPPEEHWYLPLIGVEPFAQGRGLGSAIMKHALRRVDADGCLAYLESTNPRNVALYRRFGFEPVGEIRIGRAPVVTPMVRRPQG